MEEKTKVIVFDLDGTIYQDSTFYKPYIRFMVEGTDKENWEPRLVTYVDDVLCGKRLNMNSFYRCAAIPANDPDQFADMAERAILPDAAARERTDPNETIYLGDAWAVLTFIGYSIGVFGAERCQKTYRKTRRVMEESGLCGSERLRDALIRVNNCCETILLSNSDAETAQKLLEKLGYCGIFTRESFSVEKPYGLVDAVEKCLPGALENPRTVLAVGDHAYNDLEPLRRLGCRTLWMNPYSGIGEPAYDYSLKTLDELADYLDGLCG
ncbi:MAG: HAD family hydrolase [Eubacteriales bacterium]|nr:HAD family hydrolase [Eubacteriales bacterium]